MVAHPDYSTPSSTGASFFAALGCDDAAGEYRAFGEQLKREHGATYDAWLLARTEVREELGGALKHAHRLVVAREEVREDGVLVWWSALGKDQVGLLMQRQHFLEIVEDDGRRLGMPLTQPPGAWLTLEGKELRIQMAAQDPVLRGLDPARVARVSIASEWKIADWVMPAEF